MQKTTGNRKKRNSTAARYKALKKQLRVYAATTDEDRTQIYTEDPSTGERLIQTAHLILQRMKNAFKARDIGTVLTQLKNAGLDPQLKPILLELKKLAIEEARSYTEKTTLVDAQGNLASYDCTRVIDVS